MNVEQIIAIDSSDHFYLVKRPEYLSDGYMCYPGVMVCPICLRQWAKLIIPGRIVFEVRPVSCTSCNYISVAHPVPGSIISNDISPSGVDWALLDSLPLELVKREFKLTLKAAELWNAKGISTPEGSIQSSPISSSIGSSSSL